MLCGSRSIPTSEFTRLFKENKANELTGYIVKDKGVALIDTTWTSLFVHLLLPKRHNDVNSGL